MHVLLLLFVVCITAIVMLVSSTPAIYAVSNYEYYSVKFRSYI